MSATSATPGLLAYTTWTSTDVNADQAFGTLNGVSVQLDHVVSPSFVNSPLIGGGAVDEASLYAPNTTIDPSSKPNLTTEVVRTANTINPSTYTLTFASPVTNPYLFVGELGGSARQDTFDFSGTPHTFIGGDIIDNGNGTYSGGPDGPSLQEGVFRFDGTFTSITWTASRTIGPAGGAGVSLALGLEPGDDYDPVNQAVTIPAGSTSATVTVNVNGDEVVELDETFEVNLSDAQFNGSTDASRVTFGDTQGIGTIVNDDSATLTISDATVVEGDSGTTQLIFDVTLDEAVDTAFTVDYDVNDGSATLADNDYTGPTSGTLNFAGNAGEVQQIIVNVNGDDKVELDETLTAVLSNIQASGREESMELAGDSSGLSLEFSTALNSADGSALIQSLVRDDDGNIYTFGVEGAGLTAVVQKLDPTGSTELWRTSYANTHRFGSSIALHNGELFVAGRSLAGMATTPGAFDTSTITNGIFVSKLNPANGAIIATTSVDAQKGTTSSMAFDSAGNVIIGGQTNGGGFPISAGAFQTSAGSGWGGFVMKLSNDLSSSIWGTYLSGSNNSGGVIAGIHVNPDDSMIITGESRGPIPWLGVGTTSTPRTFVVKMTADATALDWARVDVGGTSMALDSDSNIYVTHFQNNGATGNDVRVLKLNPDASTIIYDTAIAGAGDDRGYGLALDSNNATVVGLTSSTDFPVVDGFQTTYGGGAFDGFIARLDDAGNLIQSSYLGGSDVDLAGDNARDSDHPVILDTQGNAYVVGRTNSPDFPTTPGAYDETGPGGFLAKIGSAASATGAITNDDSATVSIGDATATEGGDLVFDLTLSQEVDVDTVITFSTVDGSATTADNDYTGQTAQTVTIPAGQLTAQITVNTTADNKVELDEAMQVSLTNVDAQGRDVTLGDATGDGMINNDDSATLSIADANVVEGDTGTTQLIFNVTLDNQVDVAFTVDYDINDGSATLADSDYGAPTTGTLNFAGNAGEVQQITVNVNSDDKVELDEMLTAVLSNIQASGRDVTASGTFAFSEFDAFTGTNVTQVATGSLSGVPFTMTFDDGGVGTWGVRGDFSVFDNTDPFFNTSDFTPPTNNIDNLSAVYTNGDANGTLTIAFDAPIQNPTFHFQQIDRAQWDFSPTPGFTLLTKLSGNSDLIVSGSLVHDNNGQNDPGGFGSVQLDGTFSTVVVNLTEFFNNGDGYGLQISGTPAASATGTIINDDSASLSIADASVVEGDSGTTQLIFDVTLNEAVDVPFTVDYDINDGTAMASDSDYSAPFSGTLNFAGNAGEVQQIIVNVTPDDKVELDETLTAVLSNVQASGRDVTIGSADVSGAVTQFLFEDGSPEADLGFNSATSVNNSLAGSGVLAQAAGPGGTIPSAGDFGTTTNHRRINVAGAPVVGNGEVSVSAWFKTTDASSIRSVVFGGISSGGDDLFIMGLDGGAPHIFLRDNGSGHSNEAIVHGSALNDGNWHNMVFTWTGGSDDTLSLYVDGTLSAQQTYAGVGTMNTTNWSVGSRYANGTTVFSYDGLLGDVRIFDRALSAAEVGDLSGTGGTATGTIVNDDSATVSIGDATATEGGDLVFDLTLSQEVDVDTVITFSTIDGSATTADSDYTGQTAQIVTIPAGQLTAQITVNTTADNKVELDEAMQVSLTNVDAQGRDVTLGAATGDGMINNDDSAEVCIAANDADAGEPNNNGQFTVSLSNPSSTDTTISYNVSGSADAGDDYTALSGSVTIPAGDTSATIDVAVVDNSIVEAVEDVVVSLDTVTDGLPGVTVGPGASLVDDFNDGVFPDDWTGFTGAYSESGGVLHTPAGGPLPILHTDATVPASFSPFETHIDFRRNLNAPRNESLWIVHGDPNNPAAAVNVVHVADNYGTGTVLASNAVGGGASTGTLMDATGTVDYRLSAQVVATATPGLYQWNFSLENLTTSTPFLSYSRLSSFYPSGDNLGVAVRRAEGGADNFVVDEFAVTGLGLPTTAAVNITDDDSATVSIGDATVTEGGDLVFDLTLSQEVDVDTVITFSTVDGSATTADNDYTGQTAQTVTIPAGQLTAQITVNTTADNKVELDEAMQVSLTNVDAQGRDVTLGDATSDGMINNDDSATLSIADASIVEGDTGITQLIFDVTLDNQVDVAFTVDYDISDGSATTADSDYGAPTSGTLNFAGNAGEVQQIIVNVNGDDKAELDETLTAALSNVQANGRDVDTETSSSNVSVSSGYDPWLAGMPNGTTHTHPSTIAPTHSPLEVAVTDGQVVTISATGSVFAGVTAPTPDGSTAIQSIGAANGMSGITVPGASLIGVFLSDDQPSLTPAPASLNFTSAASRDFSSLSPELKQVFFIGDGQNGSGAQDFVAPAGATRLFLGVFDTAWWHNNSGTYSVTVNSGDDSATGTIINDDAAPVANAGGPYVINEGGGLSLDASASNDADSASLTYRWDVDGDGDFDENITGETPTLTAAQMDALGLNDDASITVTVEASDGTNIDTATASLTINNVDPDFEAGPNETLNPPAAGAFSRGPITFTDPGADTWTGTVNYGDSATNFPLTIDQTLKQFSLAHTYATEGTFTVTVTVNDDDGGTHVDTFDVTVVLNSPPEIVSQSFNSPENTTAVGTVTATDPDLPGDTQSFTITGNGADDSKFAITTAGVLSFNAPPNFETPTDANSDNVYEVEVQVEDSHGETAMATMLVTVTNVDPSAPVDADLVANTVDEGAATGTTVGVTASSSDPLGPNVTYTLIDNAGGRFAIDASTGVVTTVDPTLLDGPSSYNITVRASDGAGGTATSVFTIQVNNVAPTVDADNDPVTVDEGDTAVNTGSFFDPAFIEAVINGGGPEPEEDEESEEEEEEGGGGTTMGYLDDVMLTASIGTITRNDNGTWDWSYDTSDGPDDSATVVITADDGDGGVGQTSFQLVVNNVAPEITSLVSSNPDVSTKSNNGEVSISGAFADPALDLDTHTVEVNWGDDSPVELISVDQLADTFAGLHTYATGGIFEISVTPIDSDGDAGTTQTVTAVTQGVGVVDGVLYVIGTDGKDKVHINKHRGNIRVRTKLDGGSMQRTDFDADDVTSIHIVVCEGNDHVHISHRIDLPTYIDAGGGRDHVIGGSGPDTVIGGEGNDKIKTRKGDDTIIDLDGHNKIWSGRGDDTVTTGDGNDWIGTDGGNDVIDAGNGNNDVWSGNGDDIVTTGNGHDIIVTGNGNDVINAGDGTNCIHGGAGDDVIIAGAGMDWIGGGRGNDTIDAGDGRNKVWGGHGNDVITTGAGNDWIGGGSGNDLIRAGDGNDDIHAGGGNDIVLGENGNDWIFGGRGRDILIGGEGNDVLVGGGGDDVLIGGTTAQDNDDSALLAAMAEWAGGASFQDRVNAVDSLLDVMDDGEVDWLVGNRGKDLFFDGMDDVLLDVRSRDEVI